MGLHPQQAGEPDEGSHMDVDNGSEGARQAEEDSASGFKSVN